MDAFTVYQNAFVAAAGELASCYAAQYDEALQAAICRKHGIFLEDLTDDEFHHLESLVQEFASGGRC